MSETLPERDLRVLVDRLLLEQGRLDPLELLLAADLLAYCDYEAWRMGRRAGLQDALALDPAQVADLLERAALYARGQRLAAAPLEHLGWGAGAACLRVGEHAGLVRACAFSYAPPADRLQLDLFHDSSALLLEREITQALAARRTDEARELVARLMRQDPRHRHLQGFLRLIQAGDVGAQASPEERLRELEAVAPLARGLLGHRERDFLAPLWTALAQSLAGQPFDPREPRRHASFAWARAGRWESVRAAVEVEPEWPDQSVLVLAHAEACWRLRDLASARRGWVLLCWRHPEEAERVFAAKTFPDRRIAELWVAFGDLDETLATEDFPAWLLIAASEMAAVLPPETAPRDERGELFGLVHRLVGAGEDIGLRRELGERHPMLLRQFLARACTPPFVVG